MQATNKQTVLLCPGADVSLEWGPCLLFYFIVSFFADREVLLWGNWAFLIVGKEARFPTS